MTKVNNPDDGALSVKIAVFCQLTNSSTMFIKGDVETNTDIFLSNINLTHNFVDFP